MCIYFYIFASGIFVNFSGGANVDFQGNNGEQLEFYNASESYFDTNVTVFGNGEHSS